MSIDEGEKHSRSRAEQKSAYEALRDQVLLWLSNFEGKVDRLATVAVTVELVKQQTDELKVRLQLAADLLESHFWLS